MASRHEFMATESNTNEFYVDAIDQQPVVARRPIDDAEMDITPMIDITFLLLIFFIVASRLDEDAPVELPPALHGTAVGINSSAIITVATAETAGNAQVFLGDGKSANTVISSDDLTVQESQIIAYIEEQISQDKETVLIKAEKGVKHGDVARVSRAVGKAGQGTLYVAVLELK